MKISPSLRILLLIFITTYIISTYVIQLSLIQGNSMEPTYHPWELSFINKQTKDFHHGDVIVFYCPNYDSYLTKRIIGCPGDTIEIKNGIMYVNNLPSPHTLSGVSITYAGIASSPITLRSNQYFVLGDNYEYSKDSRYEEIGYIQKEYILGTIFPQRSISE